MKHPKTISKRRLRPWHLALCLPTLVIAGIVLSCAYRIYARNVFFAAESRLPLMSFPSPPQRLLIFSPHPDDEALGAAGLMREARLHGCDVRVVVITNGDGFMAGTAQYYHELAVPPKDYVHYAYRRQGETRAALQLLGVPPDHVTFLGYPDQGLMPMWTTHWSRPFLSRYTRTDFCPYDDAPTPRATYDGASLLADVKRQMLADLPTDIYVTHPNDDHPDHAAASVFVRTALQQLRDTGVCWARTVRLHYYLVHHGDWPAPQGLHEDDRLGPPAAMACLDTRWEQLPLTHYDTERKYAAIRRYGSQTEIMGRFLYSFARRNELFGTLKGDDSRLGVLATVPDGRMRMDGDSDWRGLVPVGLDPSGESILRLLQPGGDITRVWACRDSRRLYVRVDLKGYVSSHIDYIVTLRPVGTGATQPAPFTLLFSPGTEGKPRPLNDMGGVAVWHGSSLETSVPLARVGLAPSLPDTNLYISVKSQESGLTLDSTGFRGIACGPLPTLRASLHACPSSGCAAKKHGKGDKP